MKNEREGMMWKVQWSRETRKWKKRKTLNVAGARDHTGARPLKRRCCRIRRMNVQGEQEEREQEGP